MPCPASTWWNCYKRKSLQLVARTTTPWNARDVLRVFNSEPAKRPKNETGFWLEIPLGFDASQRKKTVKICQAHPLIFGNTFRAGQGCSLKRCKHLETILIYKAFCRPSLLVLSIQEPREAECGAEHCEPLQIPSCYGEGPPGHVSLEVRQTVLSSKESTGSQTHAWSSCA